MGFLDWSVNAYSSLRYWQELCHFAVLLIYENVCFRHSLPNRVCCHSFNMTDEKWYLNVVLICISLMSGIENMFKGHFNISFCELSVYISCTFFYRNFSLFFQLLKNVCIRDISYYINDARCKYFLSFVISQFCLQHFCHVIYIYTVKFIDPLLLHVSHSLKTFSLHRKHSLIFSSSICMATRFYI